MPYDKKMPFIRQLTGILDHKILLNTYHIKMRVKRILKQNLAQELQI